MKQTLLLLITVMASFTGVQAQSGNLPSSISDFLTEGKRWNYQFINVKNLYDEEVVSDFYYEIKGDTLLNSMNCKKLYFFDSIQGGKYVGAIYESLGRYYFVEDGHDDARRIYYSTNESDLMEVTDNNDKQWIQCKSDTVYVKGIFLRRHKYQIHDTDLQDSYGLTTMIEGIGTMYGPVIFFDKDFYEMTVIVGGNNHNSIRFISCTLNGETIFTAEDFNAPAWQANKSFMAEGKKWNFHYQDLQGKEYDESLIIRGDTLIDSRYCKKLYNGGNYQGAFYEEEGKVFFYHANTTTPELLYDFSLKAGGIMLTGEEGKEICVEAVDNIQYKDYSYKKLTTRVYDHGHDAPSTYSWIEGVGGSGYLLHNQLMQDDYYTLVSCELNGEVIYKPEGDYLPLLAEGKEWIYSQRGQGGQEDYDFRYFIQGDSVVSGVTFKRLFMQRTDGSNEPELVSLLREKDRKVYMSVQDVFPLYDFSLSAGQDVPRTQNVVKAVDEVSLDGISFVKAQRLSIAQNGQTIGCWIEGVGANGLLTMGGDFYPGYTRCRLQECRLANGLVLYRDDDSAFEEMEGKVWNYVSGSYLDPRAEESIRYTLQGDTIIGGQAAKKLYMLRKGVTSYHSAWYEDGRKVYRCKNGQDSFRLEYDFDRQNRLDHPSYYDDSFTHPNSSLYLDKIDAVKSADCQLNRYLYMIGYFQDTPYSYLEGVGSVSGGLISQSILSSNTYFYLQSCYEGSICLYNRDEYTGETVGIDNLSTDASPTGEEFRLNGAIYDLQGRRVKNPKAGLYIISRSQGDKKSGIKVVVK